MITRHHGTGTLQLNRGIDLPPSVMSVAADAHDDGPQRGVKLVMKDSLPGGCAMQIVLTAEAAADLAGEIQRLARAANAKGEQASECLDVPASRLALMA